MIRWVTPQAGTWHTKSACGCYGISHHWRSCEYEAFHIDARAIPAHIGTKGSIEDAKQLCESHRAAQTLAA